MKRLILLSTILLFLSRTHAEEKEVLFATGEWPPYTSQNLPEYGAATALVSSICAAGGIIPVYKFYPWKRTILMVDEGRAFCTFPYPMTEEYTNKYPFSSPLFYGKNVFIYHSNNPNIHQIQSIKTAEDIQPYKIGVLRGSFEGSLEEEGFTFETTTDVAQSIKKLAAGRIDFYLDEKTAALYEIKKLYPENTEQFQILPLTYLEIMPNGLLISKDYPGSEESLIKFNKGLELLKQSGEYDKILKKHNLTTIEERNTMITDTTELP